MILESIDEVIRLTETSCNDCKEHRNIYGSTFTSAEAKGNKAIFQCKWGDKYETQRTFHTTQEDFNRLSGELIKELRNIPFLDSERKQCNKDLDDAIEKARIYASFAKPKSEYQFEGFCEMCRKEVKLSVRENKLYTACSPCASIALG